MAIALSPSSGFKAAAEKSRPSLLRRVFDRMVAARQLQAKRYVNGYLVTLDDATLRQMGLNRADIEKQGTAQFPY